MTEIKRSVACAHPQCGGHYFEPTYNDRSEPVWHCNNCGTETPRLRRNRRTNNRKAIDAYLAIRAEWEPVDADLRKLIDETGIPNGCLLVHASAFSFSLKRLSDCFGSDDKAIVSTTMLGVLIAGARRELDEAKAFIVSKRQEAAAK